MAAIKYRDEHNKVGFLEKPKGSDDYHQVLDFLRGSHIRYALTHDPIIYDSLVKQFWSTASLRASKEGPPAILATIDRTPYTITESLVRSQLQLDDDGGVEDLPIADIYLGMDNLGYPSEGKLTFFKNIPTSMEVSSSGEAAPSNPQTIPPTITEPDHFHDHESTPPRPTTTTLEGADRDLDKLTALSSLVSTLVQKVNTQESELTHTSCCSRRGSRARLDPLIKLAKAASNTVASFSYPTGGSQKQCKSPLMEEDPPVRERTFRQREEDKLDTDWNDIMGHVHANQGLTADLLGPDVTEYNFAERMVALIAKRRREFVAQSSTIYTTGWTMKHVKSFSDDQLKTEFDKIRTAAADLQLQNIRRSLKRPGADLEKASTKKSKSTEAPKSDVPADSQQPSVEVPSQKATIENVKVPSTTAYTAQNIGSSPKKVGTKKKRLGRKGVHPSYSTIPIEDGDPEAEQKMCIKIRLDQCLLQERQLSQVLHKS
ncbi:hypothetical protein Tco_1078682 [Tanacetum coccineum]|uniref:Xylulose kinase-1 n=1 Tax=Tanacetum coccineum TaxID=301880 RepID=A0ABQ5HPN7_9ASTR